MQTCEMVERTGADSGTARISRHEAHETHEKAVSGTIDEIEVLQESGPSRNQS